MVREVMMHHLITTTVKDGGSVDNAGAIIDQLDVWTTAQVPKKSGGRGRKSGSGKSPHGIQKLRELILELAVRGKLVPQDPNDEPASELLKKIAAEKTKLVKEGIIKKAKPLPEIGDEALFAIPQNWVHTRLGDVVDIVRGITFPSSEKSKIPEEGRIACLRTTNVQDKIEWDDLLFIRKKFVNRDDQYIHQGDIVMSMANSRELVGKVAIVEQEPEFQTAFGGFLGVLRPRLLNPFFVMLALRVPTNRNVLIDSASQTTNIANISLGKMNPLVLPIPPIEEQHRIVAKVDELMALCDKLEQEQAESEQAHQQLVETLLGTLTQAQDAEELSAAWQRMADHFDTLFTTEESIDQLKQTILQLAVMGKLVPQDPNDEPASELLKKIATEKSRLIKEGKIKKQKPLPGISDKDQYESPDGWEIIRFGELFNLVSGQHLKPGEYSDSNSKGAIPYLTGPAEFGVVSPEPTRFTSEHRAVALKGDILITCKGSGVGKLNVADQEIAISRQLMAIQPILVPSRFLKLVAESLEASIRENIVGIAIPGISREDVNESIVILPPLDEQHRIVAKVDELMAICDELKARLQETQTTQIHLADAIVEQAVI